MATTINKTSVKLALARMMGKRQMPNGYTDDWDDYIQQAFDYAWRYYRWGWSMRQATIDLTNSPFMPDDFDLDGYVEPLPNNNGQVRYMDLLDWKVNGQYVNGFAVQWDNTAKKYRVLPGSQVGSLDVVYQATPPALTEDDVPFPSSMTIGIGAAIWAKQGENPTRADVQQEWDEFHSELKRHVAHSQASKPNNGAVNLQDQYGTYTGYVGY